MNLKERLTSTKLKSLINPVTGLLEADEDAVRECIKEAESICSSLIGCTLVVREKAYILANLELYYGGIGDAGHDWYRYNYPQIVNKSRAGLSGETIKHQELEGPSVYIGRFGNHQRMDIVIGPAGVPVSILIRNVLDANFDSLSKLWTGNTKIVLDKMGVAHKDSGKGFEGEFQLLDTQQDYISSSLEVIERNKRYIGTNPEGFKGQWGQELWNFRMKESHLALLKKKVAA